MPEIYRFFNSTPNDRRVYQASDFAEYFSKVLSNGILNGGTNLQVSTDGTGLNLSILDGFAWIEGHLYKVEQGLTLTLDAADPTLSRVDRVVLRLDKRAENRFIKAFIVKGTPSLTPSIPSLVRNKDIYELSLAQILVTAGKSFIEQTQITDERFDGSVCGLVNSKINVDLGQLHAEAQAQIDAIMADSQADFDTWFNNLISNNDNAFSDLIAQMQAQFESMDITNLQNKAAEYSVRRESKDDTGTYTVVRYLRDNGTTYMKTNLHTKVDNKYTKFRLEFHALDGIQITKTVNYDVEYDLEGNPMNMIKQGAS